MGNSEFDQKEIGAEYDALPFFQFLSLYLLIVDSDYFPSIGLYFRTMELIWPVQLLVINPITRRFFKWKGTVITKQFQSPNCRYLTWRGRGVKSIPGIDYSGFSCMPSRSSSGSYFLGDSSMEFLPKHFPGPGTHFLSRTISQLCIGLSNLLWNLKP